jgi:cell division protein FtsX
MELKICFKKLIRTPVKTFLFFLLLTITGALLSLGVSLLINAREVNKSIQESFTSIAIPNFDRIKADSIGKDQTVEELNYTESLDIFETMNKSYYQILGQASETKIGKVDLRKSYLGFSKDLSTVLFEPYAQRNRYYAWNEWSIKFNMAVFDVTYIDTRTIKYDKNYNRPMLYVIIFKVNKALSIHPSYAIPDTIETYANEASMEEMGAFELGKRYIVAGNTDAIKMKTEDISPVSKGVDYINYFFNNSFNRFVFDEDLSFIDDFTSKDYFNSYIELDGDVDVFLNSSQGTKYKQLIENCQFYNQAVNLITTDNTNSMFHFNQKKAYIVNGREITTAEYERGEEVCVISWKYAELNNLNVGDEINLSLIDAKYEYNPDFNLEKEATWFLNADPYSSINASEQSFKIVGIYQAPSWEISEFMLSPNTIFAPSKAVKPIENNSIDVTSVDEKTKTFNQIPTSLYSIIIPNDRLEEFKAEMEAKGIGRYFLYYDQGYSAVKSVIKLLTQNAIIILSVCFAVWLLVLILFILLYIVKEKNEAGIMLSLGVGARRTFVYLLLSCVLLTLPSTIIGGIVSNAVESNVARFSYDVAVNQIMDDSFDTMFSANADSNYNVLDEKNSSDKENNIISFESKGLAMVIQVIQFVIILCLSSVYIYYMLRKNPMELVKSKE